MERAQNSDSETHVENLNQTSRTDSSRKSLSYIFWDTLYICCVWRLLHFHNIHHNQQLLSLCAKYFQNWWGFSLCWFQATGWDKKWLMGQKVPIHPLLFPVYENINFVPGCSSKISPVLPKFTVRILKTTQAEKISCSKAKNITAEQAQSIFLEDDFNIHLWQTEKQKVVFTLGPTGRNTWHNFLVILSQSLMRN